MRPSPLPDLYAWKSDNYREDEIVAGAFMEFRLTYEGPLLAATANHTRAQEKHEIRRYFHKQLAQLWNVQPALVAMKTNPPIDKEPNRLPRPEIEVIADRFDMCGYKFVPLITKDKDLICEA